MIKGLTLSYLACCSNSLIQHLAAKVSSQLNGAPETILLVVVLQVLHASPSFGGSHNPVHTSLNYNFIKFSSVIPIEDAVYPDNMNDTQPKLF